MTREKSYYHQLIELQEREGSGFIDPFEDLGAFNLRTLTFIQPVDELKNKYTNQPYTRYWQSVIQKMRKVYILYQTDLQQKLIPTKEKKPYLKGKEEKKDWEKRIVFYLSLGFSFREVAAAVGYTEKHLRNHFRRSDYKKTRRLFVYQKKDLRRGLVKNRKKLSTEEAQKAKWCLALNER